MNFSFIVGKNLAFTLASLSRTLCYILPSFQSVNQQLFPHFSYSHNSSFFSIKIHYHPLLATSGRRKSYYMSLFISVVLRFLIWVKCVMVGMSGTVECFRVDSVLLCCVCSVSLRNHNYSFSMRLC